MSSRESTTPDWASVRAEFPALAHWTFLNTATYGQLPKRSVEAVAGHFARRDALACTDFLEWFDDADAIRQSIAQLISADSEDIAFIPNAATALGLLMSGITWKPGDQVIALEHEFPNNLYWPSLLKTSGVEFLEVSWPRLYDSLTERTRLVLVSSVNYSTGFRVPAEELSRVLRERGILYYVDGTQSVGALQFDARAVKPDMLAVHGYKWLISPNGAGFVYVSPEFRERLYPNVVGWRSHKDWRRVDSLHHGAPEFVGAAEKYEGGMLNFPSLYAMGASVDMMLELGPERIETRVLDLADRCARVLEGAGGQIEYRGSPILLARFPDRDVSQLSKALRDQRIVVSARHGRLRVSTHFYNDDGDLEQLRQALATAQPDRNSPSPVPA
jgi:cysteine desulfurase / selenocysteine lyase